MSVVDAIFHSSIGNMYSSDNTSKLRLKPPSLYQQTQTITYTMKKIFILFSLICFAILVQAHTTPPTYSSNESQNPTEFQVEVNPVDFSKILIFWIMSDKDLPVQVKIFSHSSSPIQLHTFSLTQDFFEIDLSHLEAGSYQVEITSGGYVHKEAIVLP